MPLSPTDPTFPHETAAEIDATAAAWIARLDRGPLSVEERAALQEWAEGDTRRAGAYARAMAISLHVERVAALGPGFPAERNAPDRRLVVAMMAAGGVAACGLGLSAVSLLRRPADGAAPLLVSPKGAVRRIALHDGSAITLNTLTQARPFITASARRVDLVNGEALFDVVADPARPFVVRAGNFSVRAVGTSFVVRRIGTDALKIVVREGVVEVGRAQAILGLVNAGISFVVDAAATPVISPLSRPQLDGALAWRDGRIDLEGMTLAQAIAEYGRYTDIRFRLADPVLANVHLAGTYATNDPEGFARNAALSLGLKSTKRGSVITLSKD